VPRNATTGADACSSLVPVLRFRLNRTENPGTEDSVEPNRNPGTED
jgi:hypothetical protein